MKMRLRLREQNRRSCKLDKSKNFTVCQPTQRECDGNVTFHVKIWATYILKQVKYNSIWLMPCINLEWMSLGETCIFADFISNVFFLFHEPFRVKLKSDIDKVILVVI